MTVLDLIKKSALMLNVKEVLDEDFDSINAENETTILSNNFALNRMFEFVKVMLSEISAYYLPIVKEVEVEAIERKIPLSNFANLAKLIGVKYCDRFTKYSVDNNTIAVEQNGKYMIVYNEAPNIKSVLDEIEVFDEVVGEDILVCGLNSYYCLATGLFQEFNVYNENYSTKLNRLKSYKLFSMPCRRWQ